MTETDKTDLLTVAAVQMDIAIGRTDVNLAAITERLEFAAGKGAKLVVFPEAALSGYCFESLDEARQFGHTTASPEILKLIEHCRDFQIHMVLGVLELRGEHLHNTALCLGPTGVVGKYRKIHLPFLGVDRFTTAGSELRVFQTDTFRLGINVCYDCSFPESMRVLMLEGADVIALPTNWPPTSGRTADVIPAARALENHVYVVVANRIGKERGFSFIGKSRICDPRGAVLSVADHDREEILFAEVDVTLARRKHLVNIPGKHEVHRVEDRMPATYDRLNRN